MKSMFKILGIIMILAVVSLSGCIGEDVVADEETDVVIVDDVVDEIADEPVADDAVEVVDQVDDEQEEVISTPSSSGSSGDLVAGVDGSEGHGSEIKAKREAAEAARLAMLNALADSLPVAIDDANNAIENFTSLEESYDAACVLMNNVLEAEENLAVANATTLEAQAAFDAYNESMESIPDVIDDAEDADEDDGEYVEEPELLTPVLDQLMLDLENAEGNESTAILNLAAAKIARGDITAESIEEQRFAMEEEITAMEEAIAFREECKAAFDELHPVEEPDEVPVE